MIGAFARKFGGSKRVHEVVETAEEPHVVTHEAGGLSQAEGIHDALPEHFVERVPTEAGTVVAVPLLDQLRAWARKVRRGEDR